ncbi:MAG: MFS transporter, partial [Rhodospirillales bacterium]|nr:MFS transporter [Rhodospirillales bacterium]
MPNNSLYQRLGEHFRAQGIVRVMRHGDYARFILSSWVFTIGFWIQRIALGWLTWELTESGAWLGALAMAHSLPAIALTPFAGAIAARMDRVRLLRTTQGSQIIVAATLAALALAGLINA